jgi:membrane protein required for colicin V production
MTLFDLFTLIILGVSLIVGLARGAIQEVANVASFVLAVFIAMFALRFTGPIAVRSIHPAWAANAAAVVVVFLAAYLLLRVIAGMLTRTVHQTKALGAIDRLIGGGFGLLRGLVLLGVIGLLLSVLLPPERMPAWITSAKSYPLAQGSAVALRALAPRGAALAATLKPALGKVAAAAAGGDSGQSPQSSAVGQAGDSGYSAAARKGLDDVLEKSR